jgi:hypothetical protein
MAGGRKFPIVTLAVIVLSLIAVGLAWLVWLPLPEERVQYVLSEIEVKPIHLGTVHLTRLVDHINTEIQSADKTSYRLFLAKELNLDGYELSLDSTDKVSAFECTKLISWFSDLHAYHTPEGIVFDISARANRYVYPSWRKDVRAWLKLQVMALGW